jgi:hypothetical protein
VFGDAVPDGPLVALGLTSGAEAVLNVAALALPQAARGVIAGLEGRTDVAPPAFLDARDGDASLRLRRQKYAGVQDAILLRALEFLAIDQQDGPIGVVDGQELRDSAGLIDLCDGQYASVDGCTIRADGSCRTSARPLTRRCSTGRTAR